MSTPATILVVDDNATNRALAEDTLESEGYNVLLAENGERALETFARATPDCVLLDVRMPNMDGFEVCRRIREMPGYGETPVVFLTALRDVETFDEALRAGATDFLTKPARPTELVVRVQTALKLRQVSQELREQYGQVRRQRDDLMRLQLQKEQLMSFVVHDLKNPVGAMDLYAQLLERDKTLSERSRHAVRHIRDEARNCQRLILNLLDLSRSEEGTLCPKATRFDLLQMTGELEEALSLRAKTAEVTLEFEVKTREVTGDPDLLRRVIENLLENAILHAPERSRVRFAASHDTDGVQLRIADSGSGIPKADRERVFQRFVQLSHDGLKARSGRGLGLTFCRMAIEAHGGKIWVEDAAPGAAFCINLPQPPIVP